MRKRKEKKEKREIRNRKKKLKKKIKKIKIKNHFLPTLDFVPSNQQLSPPIYS